MARSVRSPRATPAAHAHGSAGVGAAGASRPGGGLIGLRGLLLDLDGVVVSSGSPIPGAAEALARLAERRIPVAFLTNTSLVSRASLAGWAVGEGLSIPADRIVSALSATAAWTRTAFAGRPLVVISSADGLTEFAGQRLVPIELADEPGRADAGIAAVVVGDSPDALTRENLDRAFRLVRGGARLVAMHRNPWWLTPAGPTLDSGAYVAALEYATGTDAVLIGKPAPAIFRSALAVLAGEPGRDRGAAPLPRSAIAMVGDDLHADIAPARRLGLRGLLVLTGKHRPEDPLPPSRTLSGRRVAAAPDGVHRSLAELVAALD